MPSLSRMVDGARRHFGDSLSPDDAYLSCELLLRFEASDGRANKGRLRRAR
jgi:hypothetical protein